MLLVFAVACNSLLIAQPTKAQVIKRLTHTGVVNVDVWKIEKFWDKTKYAWRAKANITKKVEPQKVDGLTGVTLVYDATADYDLGAAEPYYVGGAEEEGEYKGINLPMPSADELAKYATDLAQTSPEKFFLQAYDIVAVDRVEVKNPNAKWLHPRKLQFEGTIFYVQKLTDETFQMLQVPLNMIMHRDGLQSPWYIGKANASTRYQQYVGDIIKAADAPKWAKAKSLAESASESKQTSVTTVADNANSTGTGEFQKGDKVMVKEGFKWYAAIVLDTRPGEWYIHYEGYDAKYDLWVGKDKIKSR
jgi:RNA binding activity-knot of a chromodomain